jgi:MORN repeat
MLLPKQYIEDDRFHHDSSSILLPSGQSNISDACYLDSETPSAYIGEFKNDMLNGRGVWTTDTGERYAGDFKNNIMITHLQPTIVIQPAATAVPPQIPAPAQVAPERPTAMQGLSALSGHRYPTS